MKSMVCSQCGAVLSTEDKEVVERGDVFVLERVYFCEYCGCRYEQGSCLASIVSVVQEIKSVDSDASLIGAVIKGGAGGRVSVRQEFDSVAGSVIGVVLGGE